MVFGSLYVEDDKEFEKARKKEELIKKEDRKMKATTSVEEKKPAENKQSDDDKKAQAFDRGLEPERFLTPGFTVSFMLKLFIYTTLG